MKHFCPFARIITFYATNKIPASKQTFRQTPDIDVTNYVFHHIHFLLLTIML